MTEKPTDRNVGGLWAETRFPAEVADATPELAEELHRALVGLGDLLQSADALVATMPSVTQTAAFFGFRPVANALGWAAGET